MASLELYRQNNIPTRFEVLLNDDVSGTMRDATLTFWGDLERPIQTDMPGMVWVSPFENVVRVAQELYPKQDSLRLVRFGCEQYGSHEIGIDLAVDAGALGGWFP